jgi:hypothetical protein
MGNKNYIIHFIMPACRLNFINNGTNSPKYLQRKKKGMGGSSNRPYTLIKIYKDKIQTKYTIYNYIQESLVLKPEIQYFLWILSQREGYSKSQLLCRQKPFSYHLH